VPGEESFDDRLAAAADDLGLLVRRLRSLSPRGWQDRREPARVALAGLVALTAKLVGRELQAPNVADHVLPEAIAVVGGDVLWSLVGEDSAAITEFTRLISAALRETR
jgi:hypothetical protein